MQDKKKSSVTARYREGSRIGRRRATHASGASVVRAAERVKERKNGREECRWFAAIKHSGARGREPACTSLKRAKRTNVSKKKGKQEGGRKSPRCALPRNRPKELEKVRKNKEKGEKVTANPFNPPVSLQRNGNSLETPIPFLEPGLLIGMEPDNPEGRITAGVVTNVTMTKIYVPYLALSTPLMNMRVGNFSLRGTREFGDACIRLRLVDCIRERKANSRTKSTASSVAFVESRLRGLVGKRAVARNGNVGTGMEGEVGGGGGVGAARRRVLVDFRRADGSAKR
ncbi:hypothetical protein K0M31_014737 [Melipona bicolor]|uniref:Uncharacterized protein n=1 Tax=Melipona bicolor TaxID=60889 RepID=A0AA40KFX4_9HYME|nr:hypothetical protein K0M31_014737 [Melipona bicolor]